MAHSLLGLLSLDKEGDTFYSSRLNIHNLPSATASPTEIRHANNARSVSTSRNTNAPTRISELVNYRGLTSIKLKQIPPEGGEAIIWKRRFQVATQAGDALSL